MLRPTWIDINLKNLEFNFHKISKKPGRGTKLLFVVKADAYGHGMKELSQFAERKRLCWGFGVSSIEEGLILRKAGIKSPVLVLGSIYPLENFKVVIENGLIPTVSSVMAAKEFVKWTDKLGVKASCHIKVETGMNRIGASESSALKIAQIIKEGKNSFPGGVYSHLSSADCDREYTLGQLKIFRNVSKNFGRGVLRHIANSPGLINYRQARLDMVRAGYALYGGIKGFRQILEWKTRIVFIKSVKKGASISYNRSFRAPGNMRIATLPVGYGDGYLRAFSKSGCVLVAGKRCRIAGNVTMDMTMIDVTDLKNIRVGDEAVLTGRSGREELKIAELAGWAGTIGYEITTLITKRVPRIYKEK
ncbi:MAG: alanine racemase [Elusimicrobia bacterium CG08_land_8_20_14_0_20_51_18]|nr:MAG: alanine racemase [Elusimicrobia bacterium CG08_land_8_20_14_0_20_51_18]